MPLREREEIQEVLWKEEVIGAASDLKAEPTTRMRKAPDDAFPPVLSSCGYSNT